MTVTQRWRWLCALAVTSAASLALAEGAAHGGGHEPHVEFWAWDAKAPPIGWLVVDFAIFSVLLFRYVAPAVQTLLASRHLAVRKAMDEAQDARKRAEEKAREFEERVKRLDGELAAIKQDFRQSGEAVRDRILANARATAERMLRDTAQTIEAEQVRAREELKREAARLALELAEKLVRQRVGDADHRRLKDDFVRELRT